MANALIALLIGAFACRADPGDDPARRPPTDPATPLHNPVIAVRGLADPSVIRHEGRYYLYPTGDTRGYDVYESDDLFHWVKGPRVFSSEQPNLWAPDVFRDPSDGRFYLYYSANFRVGVAVAEHPRGPFEDRGLLIEDAIDAHMFRDDDGRYYLYYESLHFWSDIRRLRFPTGRIFAQPMRGPLTKEGDPVRVLEPDQRWERRWLNITEGPWMLKREGVYYLMYSGSAAFTAHYGIGYATATSPLGPFEKSPDNPIVKTGGGMFGPGHHSVVAGPDAGLWLVYHQKASDDWAWDRFVCIDRLWFDDAGRLRASPSPMRAAASEG